MFGRGWFAAFRKSHRGSTLHRHRERDRARRLFFEPLEQRTVLTAALPLPATGALVVDPSSYHPARILVSFRTESLAEPLYGPSGTSVEAARPLADGLWIMDLGPGTTVEAALAAFRASPWVAYAEPDYTVRIAAIPSDPQFSSLWGLHNTGQTGGTVDADIDAPEAWDLTTGSSSTIVAVIDTGVDYRHSDLAANVWTNAGEIAGDRIDNDGNGFVDDVHGYDFINEDGDPLDDQGHGTHVAGTIGAVADNGIGVAGVNWNARIMALKFLGADASGSTSDAIRALKYAVEMGAHVSNNSYGETQFSQALRDAIASAGQAGHIFVAAAGNNSANNDASPFYPAAYDLPNIVSVAATDDADRLASFSNYGATTVDLAAPGVNILSTTPNDSYSTFSGTSMAAPHVAGVLSLVRGQHPEWSVEEVIDQVLGSADFVPSLAAVTVTGGRLNAARAVGVPDIEGPRVIAVDPSGATGGPVSSLQVTMSESIDPASFDAGDIVSFVGPGGSIPISGVSVVAGSRDRKLEITFPSQIAKGTYDLVLGPAILDAAGNPMNQDADVVNGEVPDDRFTASFVIGDVHVVRSTDVPVSLSPFTTSVSTLAFDQDLSIADVDLQLDISYPEAGLLGLTLVSPAGARVSLAGPRAFLGPDYDDTIFDDEALQSINEGSAPFAGSYRPASPLSALDNTSARGTWKLEVADSWFYGGTLNSWSLQVIAHPPRISIGDIALAEGDAGTSNATFTVSLSNVISDPVTVEFGTVDGTASSGSDYDPTSGTLTFAPGEQSKTVTVTVRGDTHDEPDETFFVNLTSATNATLADAQATGTILNDETRISVGDVSLAEGNSGSASAVFAVSLSAASNQNISVRYATANGTAAAGSDYVSASGTLTFLPGETSKTVAVAVKGDVQNEADESFFLTLSAAANALIDDGQGIGTIRNDDPLPAISITSAKLTEGNAGTKNLSVTVSLSAASGRTVSVDYATMDESATAGSDFTPASGTLTFAPGQSSKTISIPISGDTVSEPDETFLVRLSNPGGAILLDGEGTGTITNDDTSLSIGNAVVSEGDSGLSEVAFTVSLSAPVDFEVRVSFATANGTATAGSDFLAAGGTLIFAPGQTQQPVTLLVLGDERNEPDETVLVNLANPVGALVAASQGIATIFDDDPLPAISISDASLAEGNAGTRSLNFTARLSAPSGRSVTVQYATSDGTASAGSDYSVKSGTLTIAAGSISQVISITLTSDTAAELDETFLVTLANPTNATLADAEAAGTIQDDDLLSISDAAVVEGSSGAAEAQFIVALAMPLSQEVRVNYATANGTASAGSDYGAVSGTLVFAAGEMSRTIAVPVIGDVLNEADESILLNLSGPVNVLLSDTQAVATIADDDPIPGISVSDAAIAEGNSGTKNLSFTVSLSAASGRSVSVQYATVDGTAAAGSDYLAKSGTVTLPPGSRWATVSIVVNGDSGTEPNESVLLNLLGATNAVIVDDQGVGTIGNDDPLPAMSIGDAKVVEGNAGSKLLSFNVALSAPASGTVTASYATVAGTAAAGTDFTAAAGTVTFAAGQSSRYITIPILGDLLAEPDETFTVALSDASGAVILDGEGLATIQNDDTSLRIGDVSVVEGDEGLGLAEFTVSLSAAVDFEVQVNFATANGGALAGADFVGTGGTLVFAPGETTQVVPVLLFADSRDEPDETFYVNLSAPVGTQLADGQGVGTIVDNDPLPSLSIGDDAIAEGNAGTKNLSFTVSLSAVSGRTVTVQYTTAGGSATSGSDFQSKSGTLTLLAGWTSATISVPVLSDATAELDETLAVILSNPSGATLADTQAAGTILDDDNLSLGDVVIVEGNGGATSAVFTVSLAMPLSEEVRLKYATANGSATAGSDYVATAGTLVFAPGETLRTIAVPVIGDRIDEADHNFYLNLSSPVNVLLVDSQAIATITDDDPLPGLSVSDVTVVEGNAGTRNLTFTVSLSAVSSRTVTVQYATRDDRAAAGSDYVARSGTLSFPAGWTSQTVTITVTSDDFVEGDERFFFELFGAANAVLDDDQAIGWILDDDEA